MGLSQGELAAGIGVRTQQLHKFEIGKDRFSASLLYTVATVLRVSVDELCAAPAGRRSRGKVRVARGQLGETPRTRELVRFTRFARALSPRARRLLIEFFVKLSKL
jgi:transcriptional regulator with XRE-family HTH domain